MKIQKAQLLKVGDTVNFPADRGSPAGSGRVTYIGENVNTSFHGVPYIWVTVGKFGVWPSNRLS